LNAVIGTPESNCRFEAMLEAGFLTEVRTLYERSDLSAEHPSMRAVGYDSYGNI